MLLSVIIVSYNVRYFLEQALLSVQKALGILHQSEPDLQGETEIWVVDNNSADGSVSMIKKKFPDVKLIENHENTGFSKANNQAIRVSTGRYVLLLNPDTVVREDTFVKCLDFMEQHPEAGALGVRMIDGSGRFLPESKRGFPTPFVAFCKTFGLSAIFPKSPVFNRYHLGFLSPDQTHEVEVLSGAFMLIRRSALEKAGLLDEDFFMYGEDIDLSWRIVKAGYKNYYFAGTTIIHYKGESTKKSSLNYVRTFYHAMLIFARKHFKGHQALIFIAVIDAAVYFRAGLTIVSNFFKKMYFPLADAVMMMSGLLFLKYFWANYYFKNPDYYDPLFVWFNMPFYTLFWTGAIFFNGGYDEPFNLRRLMRGLLYGTLLLSAIYGFLPLELRPSRAILLMGTAWAMAATTGLRTTIHFFKTGNFSVGKSKPANTVIVGSLEESERVRNLLTTSGVQKNLIGIVLPSLGEKIPLTAARHDNLLVIDGIDRLDEISKVFRIAEIIFCARDLSTLDIMYWMTRLGPQLNYKIVPPDSWSIIGSNSKNTTGELYTIEIRYRIDFPLHRRNKRLLDVMLSLGCFLFFPVLGLLIRRISFWKNAWQIFSGKKTWVSYGLNPSTGEPARQDGVAPKHLPPLRPGLFSPLDAVGTRPLDEETIRHLNFLYAKDYDAWQDLSLFFKGLARLILKKSS